MLFLLLAAVLYLQHRFVYMYFDDFGYASLSYGTDQFYNNGDQSLLTILRYLGWHYCNWGGRVLYFFAEICCLKIGLPAIRAVQALAVAGTLWFGAKLVVRNKKEFPIALLLILSFYLSIGQKTYQDGIFWFTSSCLYLWPFLPFLTAIFLLRNYRDTGSLSALLGGDILFFVAAFSQEQISVLVVIYVLLSICFDRSRRPGLGSFSSIPCALLGAGITILAPGNFVRASTPQYSDFNQLNLLGKIKNNFSYVVGLNIGRYDLLFSILLILTSILFFWRQYQERPQSRFSKIRWVVELLFSLATIFAIYRYDFWQSPSVILAFFWALIFSVEVLPILFKNNITLFALFIGGIFSQGMMLVSPTFSVRCHLPMAIILSVVAAYLLLAYAPKGKFRGAMVVLVLCLALSSAIPVFVGYYKNAAANEANHTALLDAHRNISSGKVVEQVNLQKLPCEDYGNVMPYWDTYDFIEVWMKYFYKLPQDISFVWQDS